MTFLPQLSRRLLVLGATALFLTYCDLPLAAQVSIPISVQGNVQSNNAPLNGNHVIKFSIYDAATDGNLLWTETHPAVPFTNGIYSVTLGNSTSLDGVFSGPEDGRWLEVQIGSDLPFTPRQRLMATPYANYAVNAGNAATLGGRPASDFSPVSQATQAPAETLNLLRGILNSDGSVSKGSGFTCTSSATGVYNVNIGGNYFFYDTPVVTATPVSANTILAVTASSKFDFTITATDRATGAAKATAIHFLAVGPRALDEDGDGVTAPSDCNDSNPAVYPGAPEVCGDGLDNDCDGSIDGADNNVSNPSTFYRDNDGDGFGVSSVTVTGCTAPLGYAATAGDCNDSNAAVHPGASEICGDGVDNDCDGLTDGADTGAIGGSTWYADQDGDGHGDFSSSVQACSAPAGYVSAGDDCDDENAAVYAGASEICGDGLDNDCDGSIDDNDSNSVGKTIWYLDRDGDGYGTEENSIQACTAPPGYVAVGTDCDDAEFTVHPGATEVCGDRMDNDCDSFMDEGCPQP